MPWRSAFALVLAAIATPSLAAEPQASTAAASAVSVLAPCRGMALRGASLFGRREFAEMLLAFVEGGRMGPGAGWFHPSQSRYSWRWLATQHGVGPGERITRANFLDLLSCLTGLIATKTAC